MELLYVANSSAASLLNKLYLKPIRSLKKTKTSMFVSLKQQNSEKFSEIVTIMSFYVELKIKIFILRAKIENSKENKSLL